MEAQAAFFTRPARMHAVQTRTCFLTPATTARTRFKFGFQRRRRVLFAWLITFPKCGALPQNSHFSAIFLPASVFIWAWVSCSKCRQTKLLILADHLPPAKPVLCVQDSFVGSATRFRMVLRHDLHHRLALPPHFTPLFFRTGFGHALRTSNSSHRIENTEVASKKRMPLAARTIVDLAPAT